MKITHPLVKLLLDEGLEERPDHVEDERLLHKVHLLHAQRHRLLDEGEQALGEARRQGLHLLHGQAIEVHNADDASDLGLFLALGGNVDHVQHAEHVIAADLAGIPELAAVDDQDTATLLIAVLQDIDNTALDELLLDLLHE